ELCGERLMRYRRVCQRGGLLLDAAMATALLTIVMSVALQVVERITSQRRVADRRQFALQTASNALERLSLRQWDDLSSGPFAKFELDVEEKAMLPEAQCAVNVTQEEMSSGNSAMKAISLELSWRDKPGARLSSVKLTTWVSRAGRAG